jgi:hypothetical protein
MTKCNGITLGQLFEVCGAGTVVHIAADYSNGWAFTGTVARAADEMSDWAEREILELYQHDGREAGPYCCKLDPGLAIVVEGYNDKGKAV